MKNSEEVVITKTEKKQHTQEHKKNAFKSPDLNRLKAVVIDSRTRIYIDIDESAEEAKKRYLSKMEANGRTNLASRKPTATDE